MEINITNFFTQATPSTYSASQHELGENAGTITWNNAMAAVGEHLMLDTSAKVSALRDYARGLGAWDDLEIDEWSVQECNALLIQMISGDIRETPDMTQDSWDWEAYARMAEEGTVASRLSKGVDDQIYYYLGE